MNVIAGAEGLGVVRARPRALRLAVVAGAALALGIALTTLAVPSAQARADDPTPAPSVIDAPTALMPQGAESPAAAMGRSNLSPASTGSLAYLMVAATLHSPSSHVCIVATSATTGLTVATGCSQIPTSSLAYGWLEVPSDDTYIIGSYEFDMGRYLHTDYQYWNNTGRDARLRSNATPFTAVPNPNPSQCLRFNFASMPWMGNDLSRDLTFSTSVSPLYIGAVTTLTATISGSSSTPTGVVEFYDDLGFLGDAFLSGGSATISYRVTHARQGLFHVNYRGDTRYESGAWDPDSAFVPTINEVIPGFGPTAGGTRVSLQGVAFYGVTEVLFDGVAGTGLSIRDSSFLDVTTPPGSSAEASVVIRSTTGDSIATPGAFFAYTDGSVVAGVPEVIADVSSFTAGVVRCYQVTSRAGVPVGAVGVVLNVTASLPNGVGHVRVYPDYLNNGASPPPAVSTVNFEVNRDVANSTTISLPADGKVCVYSVGGTMSRMILDVDGYILPGSGITLITPEKLVDTRPQAWYHAGSITGPVQPMTDYTVQVGGGIGSVPSDAVAVIANITVVDTRSPGHLRMWASDTTMPDTSVVNYAPETKANSQIVALSADGKLTFRSFSYVPTSVSPVQVLIDVTGYIAAGSDFVATVPTKLIETRPAYGIVGPISGPLSPGVIYPVPVDTSVVPAGATAVVLNVTAVQPTNFGHIRVYPDTNGLGTTPPPVMSNLNFIPGRDIPNMVIVQLPADRTIDLYTAYAGTGRTDLVVNIIGYIAGPTP